RMAAVGVLLVDKTGTLTLGKPSVQHVLAAEGQAESALLRTAAALEAGSEHPLARAVLDYCRENDVDSSGLQDFDTVTGKGVKGRLDGEPVLLGNAAMMADAGIAISALQDRAGELQQSAHTVVFVASAGKLQGIVAISDPLREDAPAALHALRDDGPRVVPLTGAS